MNSPIFLPCQSLGNHHSPNVLIFLHGFLGSSSDWNHVFSHFSASQLFSSLQFNANSMFIDLPFHASAKSCLLKDLQDSQQSPGHEFNFENTAQSVVHTLMTTRASNCSLNDSVTIVGYSMGGRIATRVAQILTEFYSVNQVSLILLSADPGFRDQSQLIQREKKDFELAKRIENDQDLIQFLDTWYAAPLWGSLRDNQEEITRLKAKRLADNNPIDVAHALRFMGPSSHPHFWDFLQQNKNRLNLLYITGSQDVKYVQISHQMLALGFDTRILPGIGHNVVLQNPLQVAEMIAMAFCKWTSDPFLDQSSLVPSLRQIQSYSFSIPLKEKIWVTKDTEIEDRKGVLVLAELSNGRCAAAEIAPLPGFSGETLEEASQQWEQQVVKLIWSLLSGAPLSVHRLYQSLVSKEPWVQQMFPSIRCAYDILLLHMICHTAQCTPSTALRILAPEYNLPFQIQNAVVRYNGLVPRLTDRPLAGELEEDPADEDDVEDDLLKIRVLKLKVGHRNLTDDIDLVNRYCATLPRKTLLRLDANMSWEYSQAKSFCSGLLKPERIEYLEEPLRDPSLLKSLFSETGIPYAIDESMDPNNASVILQDSPGLAALVLKPNVLGGIVRCLKLVATCRQIVGLDKYVVSNTFENGISLSWYTIFAWMINEGRDVYHGLGTFGFLKHDVVREKFQDKVLLDEGRLDLVKCSEILSDMTQDSINNDLITRNP